MAAEHPHLGSKIFLMREETYLTARDYIATCAMKTLSARRRWKWPCVRRYVSLH